MQRRAHTTVTLRRGGLFPIAPPQAAALMEQAAFMLPFFFAVGAILAQAVVSSIVRQARAMAVMSVSGGSSSVSAAMNVNASNWAIEGWTVNGNGASHRGFQVTARLTTSTVIHHVIFINDIAYNTAQAASMDDCGYASSTNGGDYFAVIGMIAQNAAQDPICLGAIDAVGAAIQDTNAGTHYFYITITHMLIRRHAAAMSRHSCSTPRTFITSVRRLFFQTISAGEPRVCVFRKRERTFNPAGTHKFYNNTCFENNVNTNGDNGWGELNFQLQNTSTYTITEFNNIAY